MKTITLVVERTVEERYTLTLDSKLGSKNLTAAIKDRDEMKRYCVMSKEVEVRIVSKREVPVLFRKRKK